MALLSFRDVNFGFHGPLLLKQVNLQIDRGERVGLLGRNGVGKSTLMRLINGEIEPDSGGITRQQGVCVSRLAQEVPHGLGETIFDQVAAGLGRRGEMLADYHRVSSRFARDGGASAAELDRLTHRLDAEEGWQINQEVETVIARMQLDPDAQCETLSAGQKRRVLLAKALVLSPDILLLDEPTNHLDIDAICWVEEFLLRYEGTLIFVTHDRVFLRKLATRIIELDRGRLTSWACDHPTYLGRKQAALEVDRACRHAVPATKAASEH